MAPTSSSWVHSRSMFPRRIEHSPFPPRYIRPYSSASRSQRKHVDHYATLSVPKTATKAQIKTRYYQLSKEYHPDVAKDTASQTKFHAVSEAYAVLGNDRRRREYDRTLGSSFQTYHAPGQHPQATTTRPSQQPGFKHVWPNHPRNRTRDPLGGHSNAARYEHARTRNSDSRVDPFMNPSVQRATGRRRAEFGAASQPSHHVWRGESQNEPFRTGSDSGEGRRTSPADGRPTRDEAAAESGAMRAVGASGLVGVIMLIAAIMGQGNAKRTS